MLLVTLELYPGGSSKHRRVIGRTIIANVGGSSERGNYSVFVGRRGRFKDQREIFTKPVRKGAVEDYPRLSYNVWRLVIRALLSAFPEERRNLAKPGDTGAEGG